jgi:non-lysosomal glucosylceramidase
MDSSARFDTDRDGMIENSGFPDQTYDIWTAKGVHAYCGGLWAAACSAAQAMASLRGDAARVKEFSLLAERSRFAYVNKLWNGRYLDYDNSTSSHQNSIMADMLAGQWYARACGLPAVLSGDKALSCYRTIFEFNVKLFGNGRCDSDSIHVTLYCSLYLHDVLLKLGSTMLKFII